jgi:hypothetical protein
MFSVISYDQNIWTGGSFPLTRATNIDTLTSAIYSLQARNLSSAIAIDIGG